MAYLPSTPPNDPKMFGQYMFEEFRKLQESLAGSTDTMRMRILNAAPPRPRNGMVIYADGTNWDPGSGEGFYGYEGGSWVKL